MSRNDPFDTWEFREEMTGVVIESTFNWYWLVDLPGEAGYRVDLANPAVIQK